MYYTRIGRHAVNARRFAEVSRVLVRHGFAGVLQRLAKAEQFPASVLRWLNLVSAQDGESASFGERVCAALTELGPTYIKFGQVLSTRPDIAGTGLANALARLQDNVEPIPFDQMEPVLRETIGGGIGEAFRKFDRDPIAAASISQVYRANLRNGRRVAVKVQRPGIARQIESDLSLMRQLAEWAADVFDEARWLDPPAIIDEFARSIRRELDFSIEAEVINRFRENFDGDAGLVVPKVYPQHSGPRMLTMEWIDGVRVDRFDAYEERHCDRPTVARIGCQCVCTMIFDHRLFHADPHPGNIFLLHENTIAFLDMGMAGRLERSDVDALADLFVALLQEDATAAVNAVLALTSEVVSIDRAALEYELGEFLAFEARNIVSTGQVAKGLDRAIEILHRNNLRLAPRFSLLLKALGTIEVVGRQLDPDVDFLQILAPYVEKTVVERFQPATVMRELQKNGTTLLRMVQQVPGDLAYLLQQMRRGRFRVHLSHQGLDAHTEAVERTGNRQALALISGALLLASTVLITLDGNTWFAGVIVLALGMILGTLVAVSIAASGRW